MALSRRSRLVAAVTIAAMAALPLAACSSGSSGNSDGKVTLNVGLFGSFGYKEAGLYKEFEKEHPNITISESSPQNEGDYWTALQTRLAGNSGLADIQALEVGRMATVKETQSSKFVDLNKLSGAKQAIGDMLPWKEKLAQTSSGQQLATGTDVGPIAMCYQPALFKEAGLPTDPTEVSKLWSSWDDYIAEGKKFQSSGKTSAKWLDSSAGLFRAITGGQFTSKSGKLDWDTAPDIKSAWDLSTGAAQDGLVTKLTQFTPSWNSSFNTDDFATIPCEGWMLTYIKGQAGEQGKGRWSVAQAPTNSNFGGSYLAIPTASQHQKEAWELVKFLTSAKSQEAVFKEAGNFPSNTGAISAISSYTDPYFNNSATGKIMGDVLTNMPAQYTGLYNGDVDTATTNALNSVAQSGTSPSTAWSDAKKAIQAAIG